MQSKIFCIATAVHRLKLKKQKEKQRDYNYTAKLVWLIIIY